jgi:hypothetical protein
VRASPLRLSGLEARASLERVSARRRPLSHGLVFTHTQYLLLRVETKVWGDYLEVNESAGRFEVSHFHIWQLAEREDRTSLWRSRRAGEPFNEIYLEPVAYLAV